MRLFLLPLFAAPLPALASNAAAHILPMWMQGGHPAVAVSLDGRAEPLRFVVDSAAGATLVDARVVRRYGLEDADAEVSQAQGASAASARLQRMRSTSWQLGSWQLQAQAMNVDLSSLPKDDDPAIDGLIGNDLTVTLAAEAGQLQLNVFEPVIAYRLLRSIETLRNACIVLRERCVEGITANPGRMRHFVEHSIGIVTALVPVIGYETASAIAKQALESGRGVYELVLERKVLSREELDRLLNPEAMTGHR